MTGRWIIYSEKQEKKRIMISYCFGILDATVLEDMMPVHPSRINLIRKMISSKENSLLSLLTFLIELLFLIPYKPIE